MRSLNRAPVMDMPEKRERDKERETERERDRATLFMVSAYINKALRSREIREINKTR